MTYIIDRMEEGFAVVELADGSFVNIPAEALPQQAKPGDIICVCIDDEQTSRAKEQISARVNRLFERKAKL